MSIKHGDITALTPGLVLIAGSFQVNASSAPDVLIGNGFTVAAPSAAGTFTVTLNKTYRRCIAVLVTVGESGTDKDNTAHVEEIDRTTTCGSFVVKTRLAATDTTTDNQQVNFLAIMDDTTIVSERAS